MKNKITLVGVILIILLIIALSCYILKPAFKTAMEQRQYDTLYLKALNNVINLTAMEKISGLPSFTTDNGASQVFDIISGNLPVKSYIKINDLGYNSSDTIDVDKYGIKDTDTSDLRYKKWIILDDETAFLVVKTSNVKECIPRQFFMKAQNDVKEDFTPEKNIKTMVSKDPMGEKACYMVYVDVNGLSKGPNRVSSNRFDVMEMFSKELYDQYPIYVGINGSTAGNRKATVTGRVASK